MQVQTNKLAKACGKVARIKSNKDYPISDYILLKFESETQSLLIRATDNYIFIECVIPCEGVEVDEEYIVEASRFIKLVSKTTKEVISFAKKGNALNVKGNGSYKFELLDEDFTEVPDFSNAEVFNVDMKSLKPSILDAVKCKSSITGMPLISGVCVNTESVWGTDSARFVSHDFPTGVGSRLVISDSLCTLIPCLDTEEATMYVDRDNEACAIRCADTLVYGAIVPSPELYPNLELLFSLEDKSIVTVNRHEVVQAIDRLSIFTDVTDTNISIAIIEGGVGLTVGGKSIENIAVKNMYEVIPTTLTVSMSGLKDIVSIMENDFIEIQYAKDIDSCSAVFICDGIVASGVAIVEE